MDEVAPDRDATWKQWIGHAPAAGHMAKLPLCTRQTVEE
jgi:hypothetical protein